MIERDSSHNLDWGLLLIRVALGSIFIVHGVAKFMNIDATSIIFSQLGVRPFFAYLVATIELVGGIGLFLGIFVQYMAFLLSIIMIFAIYLVTFELGFIGGYELEFLLFCATVGIACTGAGRFSLLPTKKYKRNYDNIVIPGQAYIPPVKEHINTPEEPVI